MILPNVPLGYEPASERERNRTLVIADQSNRKTGQDVEIGDERLILQSPNGTRWAIAVNDLGMLSATSL